MTQLDALEAVRLLLAAYPAQRLRMDAADIRGMNAAYSAALQDLPFDQVCIGITKLVKTSKWLPTIAEIRGSTVRARDGRSREGAEGWGDALAAIGRYGAHRAPGRDFEFADPLVDRVVAAIGWRELCTSEFQIADRARFIDLYEQLAEHDAIDRVAGSTTPTRVLPSGTRPVLAKLETTAKLALVPGEEPQNEMIKRLAAQVVQSLN